MTFLVFVNFLRQNSKQAATGVESPWKIAMNQEKLRTTAAMQYCNVVIRTNDEQFGKNCIPTKKFLAVTAMYFNIKDIRNLEVIRWDMAKKGCETLL